MNIKDLTRDELRQYLQAEGLPNYRAGQIFRWAHQKQVCQWEQMTDLPAELRQRFNQAELGLGCLTPLTQNKAADGTIKYLLELADRELVECVYLPEADRHTVCCSTQVGCGMGCRFCASGQNGLVRNLTVGEIVEQPLLVARQAGVRVSNLVVMGQGEPLANHQAVWKALQIINDPQGLGIGARHLTISTCGLVPGIQHLAKQSLQVNLAISLHAATDELRDYLMPINRQYPLAELLAACRNYLKETRRRISFEYVMLERVNDRPEDLTALIKLLSGLLCHINLIPFNPVPHTDFKRSAPVRIRQFAAALNQAGLETTIRKERGSNLAAACGQLRGSKV